MDKLILKPRAGGIREMIAISFPMVVANASDTVMIFTDRLFMAKLDPVLMNAAMLGGLGVYMMMTFFIGLTGYTTALSAQFLGAGKKSMCPVVTTQALIIAVLSYPVILSCRPLAHALFHAMQVSPDQLVPQIRYFNALLFIVLISILRNSFNSFFSGIGRTNVVMVSSIVSMTANIGFNYVLVFGKLGFPAMGIVGAAYGSILASFLGLLVVVFQYFRRSIRFEFNIGSAFRFDRVVMKKLIQFGYPPGLEMLLNMVGFTVMVLIFHAVDEITATAATIVFNWDMVSFVPLLGVEIGVTSLVGRYMGARRPDIAHQSTMSGMMFGTMYCVLVFVFFLFFPYTLAGVFRPDVTSSIYSQAVPRAVFMLRFASLYVLLEAVLIVFIGALRGAGDTLWAMGLSVSLHWALALVLYIMLHVFHLTPEAGWIALIAIFFLFTGLVYLRYKTGRWKNIHLVEAEPLDR